MKFAKQDALDIPSDILAEGKASIVVDKKQSNLMPTVYRLNNGRMRAVYQFVTIEAAQAYIAELVAAGMKDHFAIRMVAHRPIKRGYTKRGVWRQSGLRQVNR